MDVFIRPHRPAIRLMNRSAQAVLYLFHTPLRTKVPSTRPKS